LEPADRDLIEAKYFQGVTVRDLAGELGVTEKALESRLLRLRRNCANTFSTTFAMNDPLKKRRVAFGAFRRARGASKRLRWSRRLSNSVAAEGSGICHTPFLSWWA
jgi:hypothetical protein